MKWVAMVVGVAVLAAGTLVAVSWALTGRALERTYAINDPPLKITRDAGTLARGEHLFATRGCADCHGRQGEGRVLIDEPGLMRVVPTNLTRAVHVPAYTDDALAAAIRHGVRPDGTPLMIMPTGDYAQLDDQDVGALVLYMRTLPMRANDPGRSVVGPIGRVLHTLGKLPLLPAESVDHAPRLRQAPPVAPTVEYGRYVAQVCTGCHRSDFTGGLVVEPGTPPSANLTPHATGLADWSETDFLRLMHTGLRPDGRAVDPMMPWRSYSRMEDVELRAVWAYLASLEPVPGGGGGAGK
ncbi:c-type cytochrome [Agrilutibacter solisilvae]|uniref:C-type cytochrome n=1 Tax=Agrilutibacter solisilvae TaxID=2763317 RepID=A0A974XY47_9GAMM|nr:c-type cytochrome [Lysobacter solisilvae]QSX77864.1 c-type cytochrome [Lysobacter solisilvae]